MYNKMLQSPQVNDQFWCDEKRTGRIHVRTKISENFLFSNKSTAPDPYN